MYDLLFTLDPSAPYLALALGLFLAVWAVRRFLPSLWLPLTLVGAPGSPLSHILQTLPSVIFGAVFAAYSTGDGVHEAVRGAVAGALAPTIHHILKLAPGPYQGALNLAAASFARGMGWIK